MISCVDCKYFATISNKNTNIKEGNCQRDYPCLIRVLTDKDFCSRFSYNFKGKMCKLCKYSEYSDYQAGYYECKNENGFNSLVLPDAYCSEFKKREIINLAKLCRDTKVKTLKHGNCVVTDIKKIHVKGYITDSITLKILYIKLRDENGYTFELTKEQADEEIIEIIK